MDKREKSGRLGKAKYIYFVALPVLSLLALFGLRREEKYVRVYR